MTAEETAMLSDLVSPGSERSAEDREGWRDINRRGLP